MMGGGVSKEQTVNRNGMYDSVYSVEYGSLSSKPIVFTQAKGIQN